MWPWRHGCHRSTGRSSQPGRRHDGTCSVARLAATYLQREQECDKSELPQCICSTADAKIWKMSTILPSLNTPWKTVSGKFGSLPVQSVWSEIIFISCDRVCSSAGTGNKSALPSGKHETLFFSSCNYLHSSSVFKTSVTPKETRSITTVSSHTGCFSELCLSLCVAFLPVWTWVKKCKRDGRLFMLVCQEERCI